jgi:hypothetical protein
MADVGASLAVGYADELALLLSKLSNSQAKHLLLLAIADARP